MPISLLDRPRLSERILIAVNPIFGFLFKHFPTRIRRPDPAPPHPSAMLISKNFIYRLMFPRFFRRITVGREDVDELKAIAKISTLVYVAKHTGLLEYHYFTHLFQQEDLPLAVYTNALTMLRWMRPKDCWRSIIAQEYEISEGGRPVDPISNGHLSEMVAAGNSVLLQIPPSGLEDEGIFFTGPARALAALIDAQRKSERPIAIVPLDFLWSRRPSSPTPSVIDILFGEKESPGRIRKVVLFWRNYKKRAQATIARPIDLKTFLEENKGLSDTALASRLRGMLTESLRTKKLTITGPPIRPRSWFVQEVLGDDDLDSEICRIAAGRGKAADDVRELASRYIHEIAADVDHTYIELLDRILTYGFGKAFESFDVDSEGLRKAKELYGKGPVVFVPNHKSHADYLILSYILYNHGMTIPHIAAGVNLDFWPLGRIFRRCGAYFIRRAFRDNPLYRAVLQTYLKVLLKEGYSQEFFIEGARSRTGKLMPPRLGMLSMLCRAASMANVKNLHFIPVAITYDRVIEQKSFVSELEGAAKEKERTGHLLRLTQFLKRGRPRYGSIYVRFGEPVSPEIAAAHGVDPIAHRICHQINRQVVATPMALAAAALLADARKGVPLIQFRKNASLLYAYLGEKGVRLSDRFSKRPAAIVIEEAAAQFDSMKLISIRRDAVEPLLSIDESRRITLAYFKNGLVHFFATIGVTSLILRKQMAADAHPSSAEIISDFRIGQELLAHEFRFATRSPLEEHLGNALDFLLRNGAIERAGDGRFAPRPSGTWILSLFASQIHPFVETLLVALRHAARRGAKSADKRQLTSDMRKTGADMLLLGQIKHHEAITKDGLGVALDALVSHGVFSIEEARPGTRRKETYSLTQDTGAMRNLQAKLEKLI